VKVNNNNDRIELINHLLVELASGNFNIIGEPSFLMDDFDATIVGINMLGEELKNKTVSKDYLESIFSGIADLLFVTDHEDHISKINEAVTRILGYTEKELDGATMEVVMASEEHHVLGQISEILKSKQVCFNIETLLLSKTGYKIPVSISCSILFNNSKEVMGKVYFIRDVTELKIVEEKLKAKNADLNALVYGASHDLKGPVASSLGLINLARNETNVDALKNYIEMTEKCILRLDAILIGLNQFTKITQTNIASEPIHFESLINTVVEGFENHPWMKNVSCNLRVESDQVLSSDKYLLQSIMHNLFENALKYKKEYILDPRVDITVEDVPGMVQISVADNGIGISEMVLPEIFKMFYRGTTMSHGSGLGLYIVKSGIEKLGGTIQVESQMRMGSTFTIKLPVNTRQSKN
jgi:PAS domain S-box-containing protein